jgi:putative cell wall-binding protein/peptidoglycan/xylan/chitin deacetylase (PgdA/CDA1 family)
MGARTAPVRRMPRLLVAVLVLLLGPGLVAVTGAGAAPPAPSVTTQATVDADLAFSVERLSGSDRYATAAAVSKRFFTVGSPVAFVVTGANFPDGLAAGPAGARLNGPALFTTRDSLPAATRTELARLRPGRIYLVGGTTAVSEAVRTALGAYTTGPVTRVSGADRYATAAALSSLAYPSGATTAYVATGAAFPDALSGGAAAGVQSAPMLLTRSTALPDSTRQELERLDGLGLTRIMVVGGSGAVSSAVAAQLATIAPVERVAGDTRYTTALAVSARVFGPDRPGAMVATGLSWPDALASGPAVRVTRGPVLLSTGTGLPAGTWTELTRMTPTTVYVLGGTTAQTNEIPRLVQRWLGVCWSGTRPATGSQELFGSVSTSVKQVALTFDMGGRLDPGLSIVDFLVDNQVCTTFFPTSTMADTTEGRAIMARIAAHPELFEIGNHTRYHCDLVLGGGGSPTSAPCTVAMTSTFIRTELTSAETVLARLSGMPVRPYWRPPYGSSNSFVRDVAASVGYTKTVMWNRDSIDWSLDTTTSQIVSRITSPLPGNGSIALFHLGGYNTRAALPSIVTTLRAAGYRLTTVSDMRD